MAKVTPEIAVSDMEQSLQFYNMLGFEKDSEGIVDDKGSQWYSMAMGDAALWLIRQDIVEGMQPDEALGNGVNIYISVDNSDDVYDRVRTGGLQPNIVKDIETMWYGQRHFSLTDPDGYLLTITSDAPAGAGN
jgi:predicted enzyme related to lactoylglutathione lyase